jgi:hypothetical protein
LSKEQRERKTGEYIWERREHTRRSRVSHPETNAGHHCRGKPYSSAWGQARLVGVGEANGGRRPPASCPSLRPNATKATGPNPVPTKWKAKGRKYYTVMLRTYMYEIISPARYWYCTIVTFRWIRCTGKLHHQL